MNATLRAQAYKLREAEDFWEDYVKNITEEDILELYTELDGVYSLLERLSIVDRYSGNEILKDFSIKRNQWGDSYISQGGKSEKIIAANIACEIYNTYTKTT